MTEVFGDRVYRARSARCWSQRELGKRAGYSQPAISQYETAARDVPRGAALAIADALGVDADWLIGDEGGDDA